MAAILDHFSDRLRAGAKSDLLALSKITFVKSRTARVFYENGFKSVAAIANADPKELVPVLMQVRPHLIIFAFDVGCMVRPLEANTYQLRPNRAKHDLWACLRTIRSMRKSFLRKPKS